METKHGLLQEYRQALRSGLLAAGAVLWLVASVGSVDAATLTFVLGEIIEPEFANEGDTLKPGDVIETGADGLIMVEHSWRSDQPYRDCVEVRVIGANQSFTIADASTPGQCFPTRPGSRPDTRTIAREIRYGDAKRDELQKPPLKVTRSQADWRAFDAWLRTATRTLSP